MLPRLCARAPLGALGVLLVVCVLLVTSSSRAQAVLEPSPEARVRAALFADPDRAGRFARAASWVGLFSGALLLSGSIAITVRDDPDSEQVTRSIHLGLAALSTPFVALGGWTARRRAKVEGYEGVRRLGWTSYTAAMAFGVGGLYGAFNDTPMDRSMTIVTGVLSTLSVLPLAFDAYVCAHQARLASISLAITPLGVSGRF